jgi:predicted tellurium resistance membrane protein TerC
MTELLSAENLVTLVTLTGMEIVLGIDNIVFIAILAERLPEAQQKRARRLGLILALVMRLGLLFTLSWIMGLTRPLFTILGNGFSGRDLVMLIGGIFLIGKATHEVYDKMEADHSDDEAEERRRKASFAAVLAQIMALDIVFSLDSVITAVGMAQSIWIMVIAMILSVGVMLLSADSISGFINRHPSMKILALSFLILIGVLLVAEGFGKHVPKGYIYFSMAFSLLVELVNMRIRRKNKPVVLHGRYEKPSKPERA